MGDYLLCVCSPWVMWVCREVVDRLGEGSVHYCEVCSVDIKGIVVGHAHLCLVSNTYITCSFEVTFTADVCFFEH